jgi:hypothetical protein
MEKKNPKPLRGAIYTLAQSGTLKNGSIAESADRIVFGAGSELGDNKVWRNRAKRKTISQRLNLGLIQAAEKKGEPERIRGYWNAYYCQNRVVSHDGRIYGKYCKSRTCTLCCSIRKAEIINRYLPVLQKWETPFFVTLTAKAVRAEGLARRFFVFKKVFRRICEKHKKRNQRGNGQKLIGIKSLECNFNPAKQSYNPHFHVLVPNEWVADVLIKDWLKLWTRNFALPTAQHKRPVQDLERDLVEVIKYGSKVFTEPDTNKTAKGKSLPNIHTAALHNIVTAMEPYRIFERFGFNLPKVEKERTFKVVPEGQSKEWVFNLPDHDWKNPKTEERLTGYTPTARLLWLLEDNMDTDLE